MTLPEGWNRRPEEECDPDDVAEWVRETGADGVFIVNLSRTASGRYALTLSTIERHDSEGRKEYRVGVYDEKPPAMGDAERFVHHVADEVESGSLSRDWTSESATIHAIWDFKGGGNWLARVLFRFYG